MLSLSEVSEFKKYLLESNGTVLHFHDTCGGQSFSVSDASIQTIELINAYLSEKHLKAAYSDDRTNFRIIS